MAAASPSRITEAHADGPTAGPSAGRVLVLSRDLEAAERLSRMLGPHSFRIHRLSAASEGGALAAASDEAALTSAFHADAPPEMILLDGGAQPEAALAWVHQLAEQSNGRLAEHGNGSGSPAPILLLIEAQEVSFAAEAVRLGAYESLVKPFSEGQLLASVARIVEYRRLRVQNNLFRHHLEQLIAARTAMLEQGMRQLEQSYDVTLEALGNALDLKDAETEGHSKRVTAYTLALGRAMGLNEQHLRIVGRGAFLHDIGKMAIPDAILRKPGKLTEEERAIMRTHSELGYRMIRKIPFLREAAEIVYSHQESYDGSGYPRGLRGEQIHIGARIFSLADTFDAITSNRPYRKANTIAEARRELLRCAGTQFDPSIVDVFVATPDSIWQNLREGIMRDGPEFSPFGYTFGAPAATGAR